MARHGFRPWSCTIPAENVCVVIGRRPSMRGGNIFVSTEEGLREAAPDEEKYIRERFPEVNGLSERLDVAARLREAAALREAATSALEFVTEREKKLEKTVAAFRIEVAREREELAAQRRALAQRARDIDARQAVANIACALAEERVSDGSA